jgi:hypothetical protein
MAWINNPLLIGAAALLLHLFEGTHDFETFKSTIAPQMEGGSGFSVISKQKRRAMH